MTITLILTLGIVAGLAAMAALLFRPMDASAHCDTMEGPAVQDGQLALETGNVNVALKWVHSDGGAELSRVFDQAQRSEEHTSELQSLMRISYAVFCLKKKKT